MNESEIDKAPATQERGTAQPEPPPLGLGDQAYYQRQQRKGNVVLWGIFAVLLALAGGVFFILPRYISPPAATTLTPVEVPSPNSTATTLGTTLSPFEEAQRLRQREAAQETLAALLELQEALDAKQVTEWDGARYEEAIALARQGDEAYRQQQFVDANARYQESLARLQAIDAGAGEAYNTAIATGDNALGEGDAEAAEQAYSRALLIDPDSSTAVAGLERADALTGVLALLAEGEALEQQGELEAARERYQQAHDLDPAHPQAEAAITAVTQAIGERDFAAAMSRGYAALQDERPEDAKTAFEQAGRLQPGSEEVAAALQQAQDQQTFATISVHLDAARRHEAAEGWQAALDAWNEALTIDPNLVTALEGQRRSNSRNNLDKFLEMTIANPLRLADDAIYQQTRQVLADASRIPDPGPRLRGQMRQIEGFLERARVPVAVQLQSDGVTQVTLYRVGELGQFSTHSLNLLPGNYTAIGIRPGYRDVREEFVVGLDGSPLVVTVACTETI